MELQQGLLSRRTVHRFVDEPIPEGAVDRALKAAIRAPNHKLTNPWRFTRVGPEVRDKLADLGMRLKKQKRDVVDERYEEKLRQKYVYPAELVVVTHQLVDDDFRRREDYAATCCAIQNFMLSLWAEDVGVKWSTGSMTRHENTFEWLEIDPDDERMVAFLWVGIPAQIPDTPREPLDEVVRETD